MGEAVRSNFIDGWKGLCIIAVVALHAYPVSVTSPGFSWHWRTEMYSFQLISFPVAVFLAFAGYFSVSRSNGFRVENAWEFYQRRFRRILPPYLIWTAITILLEHRSDLHSVRQVTKEVVLGTGIGIGYYVIVLMQFVLLTPWLANIERRRTHLLLITGLTVCGLGLTYGLRMGFPRSGMSQFPYYCVLFLMWYPCYHAGLFAAKFEITKEAWFQQFARWSVALYVLLAAASIVEGQFLIDRGYPLGGSQLKASSLLASVALFLLALARRPGWLQPVLETPSLCFLGRESYIIYLAHLLFLQKAASMLDSRTFFGMHKGLEAPVLLAVSLGACALLAGQIRRWMPRYGQVLGA